MILVIFCANFSIFNVVTDLFECRVINKSKMMITGSIGRKSRCEYSYVFARSLMLLLIELKLDLRYLNDEYYSNIVAQVCGEADGILFPFHYPLIPGCSVYNASVDLDRAPVQVILTDSLIWNFTISTFLKWKSIEAKPIGVAGFLMTLNTSL